MKEELEKLSRKQMIHKIKFLRKAFWTIWVVGMIGISLISIINHDTRNEYLRQEKLNDEFLDFSMFLLNITIYCAEQDNITYEEFMDSYLEYEFDRILNEYKNETEFDR